MKILKKLSHEKLAVSTVIGLILMVAITSSLAATSYVYISSGIDQPPQRVHTQMLSSDNADGFELLHIGGDIIDEPMSEGSDSWENLEVKVDGSVVDPSQVTFTRDGTYVAGDTIQVSMPLSSGSHSVDVVYIPTNQLIYSGTVVSSGSGSSPPSITIYSDANADGEINHMWGVTLEDSKISINGGQDGQEANLYFYESSATPVWWSTTRAYFSFDTSILDDLSGREVTLWVKMKRVSPIKDGSRYWVYYGHNAIGPELTELDHDCCDNYAGLEIDPTGYDTTYEWKSFSISNDFINTEGYTDFEFKPDPNMMEGWIPTDPRWSPESLGDSVPDISLYMTEAEDIDNDPYLIIT